MKTKNTSILSKGSKNNFNDRIYTPEQIVKEIIEWVNPIGSVLEPFKGAGAFYDQLVKVEKITRVDYTEIDEGKDFLKVKKHYDYIITNPPYSVFTEMLEKCFEVADNVILLIPHNKIFTSDKRLDMVEQYGTFTYKRFKVPKEWPAKFPIAAYWFKKDQIKDIDYWTNIVIEESDWEVYESLSDDYKWKVISTWNTTDKLFKTDQNFIDWAAEVVGGE